MLLALCKHIRFSYMMCKGSKKKIFNNKLVLELNALKRDLSLKSDLLDQLKTENDELKAENSDFKKKKDAIAEALISAQLIASEIERDARESVGDGPLGAAEEYMTDQELKDFLESAEWI